MAREHGYIIDARNVYVGNDERRTLIAVIECRYIPAVINSIMIDAILDMASEGLARIVADDMHDGTRN